jgi:hypothetical protein
MELRKHGGGFEGGSDIKAEWGSGLGSAGYCKVSARFFVAI